MMVVEVAFVVMVVERIEKWIERIKKSMKLLKRCIKNDWKMNGKRLKKKNQWIYLKKWIKVNWNDWKMNTKRF